MKGSLWRMLAALSLSLASIGAIACSVVRDYRVPTNFELVRDADLVAVGTVEVRTPYRQGAEEGPTLTFKPVRFLKGGPTARHLVLQGVLDVPGRGGARPVGPIYTRLDEVHPSALMGACDRQLYAAGTLVLAMFNEEGDKWVQYSPPFARALEDVPDARDATWVRAAALYAEIARLSPGKQRAALVRERKRLAASGSAGDREIAEDIGFALDPRKKPASDRQARREALWDAMKVDPES